MQINVYDFDSTLAITKEKVIIKNKEGEILKRLNPHEYAEYQKSPNEIPDYTDFKTVTDAEINKPVFDNFIRSINSKNTTYILTARGSDSGVWIYKFLQDNNANLSQNHIITLDSSDPQDKSHWIKCTMLESDIPSVFFCDDSIRNIRAVNHLRNDEVLNKKFGKRLRINTKHIF